MKFERLRFDCCNRNDHCKNRTRTSQNLAPIWFPHWPPWTCTISLIFEVKV